MGVSLSTDFPLDPSDWSACQAYGFAVDLFNLGYYWEAHEVWEGLWNQAGRAGATADFLKGLIKLAAALVKAREGRPLGVERHGRRAAELFRVIDLAEIAGCEEGQCAGLSLTKLATMAESLTHNAAELVAAAASRSSPSVRPFDGIVLTPKR